MAVPNGNGSSQRSMKDGDKLFKSLFLGALALFILPFFAFAAFAVAKSDGSSGSGGSEATTINVELSEFKIEGNLSADPGKVTLNVSNVGSVVHNIDIPELGVKSEDLDGGESTTVDLGNVEAGTYEVFCAIAGHKESGMVATLTIAEGAGGGAPEAISMDHSDEDYAEMDRAMMESLLAFPAETEGIGNPVLEPTEVLPDGTKVFDLVTEITQWEVEPGRMVDAWSYNGVVPGPQILLDRGDKVQVRVENKLPMGTDVHWHGVHTPNDQDGVAPLTQELIEANGGKFTYEFVADDAAIGMYHAHNHGEMQVVNGLFGVIRIGDNPVPRGQTISGVTIPNDVTFAEDIPMVLNDAGTIGYSLNGKSFPATAPLVLKQGDWVSVTYYNEGLQIHPMHLHQFPQLVYAKDGIQLEEPYWADTLNVAPGERYTVMFRADDVGTWVWHCHILNHVERRTGMFGMVTAIIVEETPGYDPKAVPVEPTNWRTSTDNPDAGVNQ